MHSHSKILLIIAVHLVANSLPLLGQQYLHEPTIWKQFLHTSSFPTIIEDDYTLELKGDTVINNKVYFKVLKSGTRTQTNSSGGGPVESPIYKYISPIREEDQKFYGYNIDLQEEFLLHDFDLEVGDTAYYFDDCTNDIVVSIDTVYLGNIPRKRFHFGGQYNFVQLIEGVGSTRGLEYGPCNDFPAPVFLQCFVQDQNYIQLPFPLEPQADCPSLIVVSTENTNETKFSLYPNPFIDEINIQTPSSFAQPLNVAVTDMLGTIIYKTQIDIPKDIETINIENIPTGLYVEWLSSSEGARAIKLLKQ